MERLILFGDSRLSIGRVLIEGALRAAREFPSLRVVAVCDTSRRSAFPSSAQWIRVLMTACVRTLADPRRRSHFYPGMLRSVARSARRHRVPLVIPHERQVNHPQFLRMLREDVRPTMALSLGCTQILRRELLDIIQYGVNYHNGLLPGYRGAFATGWSLYQGEAETGFTFHRLVEGVDEGPILLEERMPCDFTAYQLEVGKTLRAEKCLARVLQMMLERRSGTPQGSPAAYFSVKKTQTLRAINDPGRITLEELEKRLRCFGVLRMRLGGVTYDVTSLRRVRHGAASGNGTLCFTTLDGITLQPERFLYLPKLLYFLWRRFAGGG